jgi:hypothetical protein
MHRDANLGQEIGVLFDECEDSGKVKAALGVGVKMRVTATMGMSRLMLNFA